MKERIRRSSTRNEASLVSFESTTTSKLPLLSLGTKYFRQVLQENAVCLCDDRTRVRCSKIKEKTEKKKRNENRRTMCYIYCATMQETGRYFFFFFFSFIYIFTERKFGGDKVIKWHLLPRSGAMGLQKRAHDRKIYSCNLTLHWHSVAWQASRVTHHSIQRAECVTVHAPRRSNTYTHAKNVNVWKKQRNNKHS